MNKITCIVLICITLVNCKKHQADVPSVIYDLAISSHTALADGTGKISVSVKLNRKAEPEKRTVIFKTSSGNFVGGQNGTLSVKAEFEGDDLIARTSLPASFSPGTIIISAMPDLPDKEKYVITDSIILTQSEDKTITLQTNSYGIRINYQSEDTITGLLKNMEGNGVSNGTKVLFENVLADNTPAGGKFRNTANQTGNNSGVSTIFSIDDHLPVGTDIIVRCSRIDAAGNPGDPKDSVILTIIP